MTKDNNFDIGPMINVFQHTYCGRGAVLPANTAVQPELTQCWVSVSDGGPQLNKCCLNSKYNLGNNYFGHNTLDIILWTSTDFRLQISDFQLQTSNFGR